MPIDIREEDVQRYLDDCTRIEPLALEEEYVRLPADLAYWNNRYAQMYRLYLERKMITRQVECQLNQEARTRLEVAKRGGRVLVGEVEAEVILDPSYQKAKTMEDEAEAEVKRLYGVLDALRTKRDMLISLGAHMRQEMQNDPTIRRSVQTERAVDEARRER